MMEDPQIVVLEIVKAWLEDGDYSVLAAEKVIVNWSSVDGNAANLGWKKQSLVDVVNILRGTTVSLELMKYMNNDVLMAAAQESERIYERGVTVHGKCLPQFFNYASKRNLSATESIIKHTIQMALDTKTNVLSSGVNNVINLAHTLAQMIPPTAVPRNRIINSFKEEMYFNYRHGRNRLHLHPEGKLTKYTCIQLWRCLDTPTNLDEKTEGEWARIVMNKALIG
jgi:hypothetical protein